MTDKNGIWKNLIWIVWKKQKRKIAALEKRIKILEKELKAKKTN